MIEHKALEILDIYSGANNYILALKTKKEKEGLWKALLDDKIDVIATEHGPHTLEEKQQSYTKAPSGGPLVQHALPAILKAHKQGLISIEKIVEKMCTF